MVNKVRNILCLFKKILLQSSSHPHFHSAVHSEVLGALREGEVLYGLHHFRHSFVGKPEGEPAACDFFAFLSLSEGIRSGGFVGADESGDAEFYAPEVADNYYCYVAQPRAVDLPEYGSAGRACGFAVITRAPELATASYAVGHAVMARVVVLLSRRFKQGLDLGFALHRIGESYETASLVLEKSLRGG